MTNHTRTALVTGANKGIGLEIARQLAEAGVAVMLGARDEVRGQAAAQMLAASGLPVTFVQLDVTDPASVAAAADRIGKEHGRLDILVNNAAIFAAGDGPPGTVPMAAVLDSVATNFLGALAVTQAMLPLLRLSAAGRIVNLSSPLGSLTIAGDPTSPFHAYRLLGYNVSKAALNLMTRQLAAELAESGITVNAVVPGFVQTDLTGQQGTMTPAEGAQLPVRYALLAEARTGLFVSPEGAVPW